MGRALRKASHAGGGRDGGAQPGDDGATDLEAVHAQSPARALPAAGDEPDAGRLGSPGPHRPRRLRRAVPAPLATRHADRARGVRTPAAPGAARSLRASGHRVPGRAHPAMKLYYFSEMPHHEFPDEEGEKYPSLRLVFPNRFFRPERAHANYQRYLDEYELADQVGFDGLMLNEHHSTPSCVNVGVNMTAAVLGRITKRAKLLLLGNILPIEDNPVRLAEQIALVDLISGGRVLSGFVRGVGVETWWSNTNPVHNRERFEECHDLILKCWTDPGPFRWEGKHYHFRHVNPWCLPLQKPHPPIWIPGTASPETAIWAGRRGYTYVPFLVPFDIARQLFDFYRQGAAEAGRTVTVENLGFLICAVTADTKAKALEAGRHFVWRMGPTLRAPVEWFAPVGMRSRAGSQFALRARPRSLASMSYEELVDEHFIIAGTPDEVADRFALVRRELGIGHLLLEAQESRMDHPTTMRSIELMGAKVIPAIASL